MMPVEGKGMPCPQCSGKTRTLDSRTSEVHVRRRRQCKDCGHRFSTRELEDGALKQLRERITGLLAENAQLRDRLVDGLLAAEVHG
jgi:transcriptional regulator NrdR family protein